MKINTAKTHSLEELPFFDSTEKIKNSIKEFESKPVSKDEMEFLKMFYPDFPIIPVEGKCYLIAVSSKNYRALVWGCNWFEIESAFRDKNNVYHINFKVYDKIFDVDYSMLYPKNITGITKYGIVIDIDFSHVISKYIFKKISKLDIKQG